MQQHQYRQRKITPRLIPGSTRLGNTQAGPELLLIQAQFAAMGASGFAIGNEEFGYRHDEQENGG